ncbi:MAG: hypothetical protein ACSHYA_06840 [Opitutaceae bacterium]
MKTKEEWLDDMELRLKRAFLDVAELSEEEAQRFLGQEIRSHLDDVTGEAVRREYLLNLRERFPLLLSQEGQISDETLMEMSSSSRDVSPDEAIEILKRNWDDVSPEAKESFLETCAPQQPKPSGGVSAGDSTDSSAELTRYLKLSNESQLSSERLQQALLSLLKTAYQIDALGTQVYKQLGLTKDLSNEDLRRLVGRFLTGDGVELNALNDNLDEIRSKVVLIISSIASLPATFGSTHLARFQPGQIEKAAGTGGLLGGKEAKCWKKYVSMAEDIQPQKVEKAINDLLVKQLKKLKRS